MFLDLTSATVQPGLVTAAALLAGAIGLLALLRSGHWLTTLLYSSSFLSLAAFEAGTLALLHADSTGTARTWAGYLAFVSALTSWLWLSLSVVLARPDPWVQIRNAAAYLTLALLGCLAMALTARSPWIVREVTGAGGGAVIWLGAMGKIYLMYLVLVMVAVLMNLERMLRTAPASAQHWLRPMFLSFLVGILTELLVVSGGLLTGGVRVAWMAASAAPLFGAASVTALALARRRLSDMSVPVARPVIYYSSVSLTLAGAFLITMAVLSKVLPLLPPRWKEFVSIGFYVLVVGGGVLLILSPRVNRAVRRFIDRNFYANRYDYRREWERVSGGIVPTARPEDVCRQIESLVCSMFDAERVAIYLRDEPAGPYHRVHGPLTLPPSIPADNPLVRRLEEEPSPLLLKDLALDLDLIPVAVENRPIIQALSAEVVAPLSAGDALVGMLWVSEKRTDEVFTAEDVEFLGAMSRQLAAALWFARLAEQLAETRQLESLHRLSSYVLHDIKNHVSGLSLVVENAHRHMANPEFQRDAMIVVERTVSSLKELMAQVAGMGRPAPVQAEPCSVRGLLDEAGTSAGLSRGEKNGVSFVVATGGPGTVLLDRRLMLRVLANLLTNAREALSDGGEIEVIAEVEPGPGSSPGRLNLKGRDSGRGMTDEFIRTSLFRPFASTKPSGLGVGLSQCKSIVEAHGGTISVESRPGAGTTFCVRVPARVAPEVPENGA